ncbi:MAG: Phosphate butyryltransferase [Desulfotomaculum sp. 46_296]|nr:MAG: Phosphate butyryltransferase [Desulfotomaculum sp. 46_296]HAU31750.1 phosphate butyryltransferase [Desulfotomaculum sp.]
MLDYLCSKFPRQGEKPKVVLAPAKDQSVIDVLLKAVKLNICRPVIIGNSDVLAEVAQKYRPVVSDLELIEQAGDFESIKLAVKMIKENRADILMQGDTNRKDFLNLVLDPGKGLAKRNSYSYVSLLMSPKDNRFTMITDTFIHTLPNLQEKSVIVENALKLALPLKIDRPKVAVLAAIEKVNPRIPSTVDAAVLAKMSERKQFGDAVVEGPLDIDCATSREAAARKKLDSVVPGDVDIYVVPNVESGYAFSQMLAFVGKMPHAGVLVGTAKPVVVNVPFIGFDEKVAEIALSAMLL